MNTPPLILLVDDEQDILDVYETKLKMAGWRVITASNGKEALTLAKENLPDLILLDLKMPEMNGTEVFANLQEDDKTANLKVVFLTAFSDPSFPESDEKIAKSAGALDYLKKGMALDVLVEKVKGYLGK